MRVIGRETGTGQAGRLGRYRARDGSDGAPVALDLDAPHVAAVVGKRGSGKSHTLGVLAEELARADGLTPVVADPMGAFAGLASRTDDADPVSARVREPRVPADTLGPAAWCRLLDLDPTAAAGTVVWRAAARADTLPEMRSFVADTDASAAARRGAANHLRLAASWGAFDPDASLSLDGPGATVLDCSGLADPAMNAAVAAVARRLYDGRRAGEFDRLPWLLVDEAHAFFEGVAGPALRTLLTRGRQPGVSLAVATQRPTALPDVTLSQADLLVAHHLTGRADREALARARPAYAGESLVDRLPAAAGAALVVDDATEAVHAVQVRERATPHGGASPRASDIESVE